MVKKISADMSDEAYKVLEEIAADRIKRGVNPDNAKADAIRVSLGLMNFFIKRLEEGSKIILRYPSGEEKEFTGTFIDGKN